MKLSIDSSLSLCDHYPVCGGCSLQHISCIDQAKEKENLLLALFSPWKERFLPFIPAKTTQAYRNKMEFSFSQDRKGEQFLGLIAKKSRGKVLNLRNCHIAPLWMVALCKEIREWWGRHPYLQAYHFRSGKGCLRTLTTRYFPYTGEKMVILTITPCIEGGMTNKEIETLKTVCKKEPNLSVYLRLQQTIKGQPTRFYEIHLQGPEYIHEKLTLQEKQRIFRLSPSAFFQPNTEQAEIVYNTALSFAHIDEESHVLDLYAGIGVLGLAIAHRVKKVISIEQNPYAIFDAKLNAELNQINNIEFLQGDVEDVLPLYKDVPPHLVIVDPPRVGLSKKALDSLLLLQAEQILYISCNPLTQLENLQLLLPLYEVVAIQGIDQFPHTKHVENILFLKKKK